MRQITLIVQAGKVEEFAVDGDYVRVKSAGVPVRIEAETGQVDATIEQGDALNLKPFKRLRVSHSDAAEQTIALMIGNGTSADSARVGGNVEVSKTPTADFRARVNIAVGLASIAILPDTLGAYVRRGVMMQNIGTGTAWVVVNNAGVVGAGFKLEPGQSLSFGSDFCPQKSFNAISDSSAVIHCIEGA